MNRSNGLTLSVGIPIEEKLLKFSCRSVRQPCTAGDPDPITWRIIRRKVLQAPIIDRYHHDTIECCGMRKLTEGGECCNEQESEQRQEVGTHKREDMSMDRKYMDRWKWAGTSIGTGSCARDRSGGPTKAGACMPHPLAPSPEERGELPVQRGGDRSRAAKASATAQGSHHSAGDRRS